MPPSPPVHPIRIPIMSGLPWPTSLSEGVLHAQESKSQTFGSLVGGGLETGNRLGAIVGEKIIADHDS